MIEFVIGGARSGKSAYAESQASASGLPVVYLATGEAGDGEMAARITHHRARRPKEWACVEEPVRLAAALEAQAAEGRCVIVDCLTLWLTNLLLGGHESEVDKLLDALPRLPGRIILVSNEVGWGIVPANELARRFGDEQGRLNQRVAAAADKVTLVAAGLPLTLKSSG